MNGRRLRLAVAALLAASWFVAAFATSAPAAPASSSSTQRTGTAAQPRRLSLLALGDSVPRGINCACTPYPTLTGDGLATRTARTVEVTNDSVSGATTASVLRQLERSDVIAHLRTADAVEIEIGANDVGYSRSCGTSTACYASRIPTIKSNLGTIVSRVHELAGGRNVKLVLLDYWSVWLGGRYAAAKGDAYVAAAATMTGSVNRVIKSTAAATGSAYVDLRAAFKGPSYAYDETHYLSNDGDHPNKAGHKKIAGATLTVLEKDLHL